MAEYQRDLRSRSGLLSDLRESVGKPVQWVDVPFAIGMKIRVVQGPKGFDQRRADVIGMEGELSAVDDRGKLTDRRYLFVLANGETVPGKDIWWVRLDGQGYGDE